MTKPGDELQSQGAAPGRDGNGRFGAGNAGGPGSPLAAQAVKLRRAAMEAVSPEIVSGIMRRVARKALEGDLKAARLVLDRAIGRPREESEDAAAIAIQLPPMRTADECTTATGRILEALTSGQLSRDDAKVLIDAVQLRTRTLEQADLEHRLRELEDMVAERLGKPKRRRT